MIFEILGSRILGPYFGTSIFVWTSLIGIIMGSLSVGYWLGGVVSDKRKDYAILAWMLLLAGVFMLITALGHDYALRRIVKYIPEFRLRTVFAVVILFGPASVFLAMVLPYTAKMVMINVRTSGSSVGNLYALSTIGSILGTFSAGFLLVPAFGYALVLFSTAVFLMILALTLFLLDKKTVMLLAGSGISVVLIFTWFISYNKPIDYLDIDTQYNRVLIYHTKDEASGRPVKMLKVNDEKSSAMFTDADDDLVFDVLKYYRLVEHFNPDFRNSLMIGGSGYAFPKDYLRRYSEASIDVVEIDPGLTKIAKQYFNLTDDPRLKVYHEDGRTYLNKCEKKYDAIFMDAYKSMLTVPYQLTTSEAVQKMHNILNENGAVYANIISALSHERSYFLRAELATYKSIFPQVFLFAVQFPSPTESEKESFQNFLLIGLKSSQLPDFVSEDDEMMKYLSHFYPIEEGFDSFVLTDDFAPVEFYASRALNRVTRQK
jgi:predicted membrane-bound spermidine synthase